MNEKSVKVPVESCKKQVQATEMFREWGSALAE